MCVQETRWVGSRERNADGYKLWYSGVHRGKNGVGILVDSHLRESVVEDEEIKRRFWEGLDDIVCSIPPSERLFIGRDFNGHIGSSAGGYTKVHGGFGFGEQNGGGTSLLDFAKAFDLVIANSSFPKREKHLVTYQSSAAKTQIDYLLLQRCDRRWCEDCKVIPGETLATQYQLLVMDIGITIKRKKRSVRGRPRIRWGSLTEDKAQELAGRLSAMGAWRSSGDANTMWSTMADSIKKEATEVLGISSGRTDSHKGDWWWNVGVQGKVEAKKAAYLRTQVRTVGGDSEYFPVVTGLHQGSAFSPFLFALVMDAITHNIQGEVP
ncbi:uncharacterized protein [Nicotiana sylvestris]|uniref:uncharacterized protein n=1 Tax=Nicotiana sylvestris TaxID=4096 RepID=UPI00388CAA4F